MPFNGLVNSRRRHPTYQDTKGSSKQLLVPRGEGKQAKLTHKLLTEVLEAHRRGVVASDLSTMFDLKPETIEAIVQD